MKYVEVRATPDLAQTSEVMELFVDSHSVDEARQYEWNFSPDERPTILFEVVGDSTMLSEELRDIESVLWFDVTDSTDSRFNLLVVIESDQNPSLRNVLGTLTREKLIAGKPVVYRDGQLHARIIGNASELQSAVMDLPPKLNVDIVKFGDYDQGRETPVSQLSPRQQEALFEAFSLGYYERPRQATHEDIAARLGCAPNTASAHLQKAERAIVTEALQPD